MVSQKEKVVRPFELLLDQKRIAQRVKRLGAEITADYAGQRLVLVGVLKGCVVFMADLMRHIELPCELEFISAASYRRGIKREEDIILGGGVAVALKGRHVLIVDGIVDSARTVSVIYNRLMAEEPASLEIVTLLDKPASHRSKMNVKYKGFSIGNEFVIGYGLDNTQLYRNLPFVGHLIDR
jgi:hypoxanthine phosphoribosyltransferase